MKKINTQSRKRMFKNKLLAILLGFPSFIAFAQQESQYTQYMYNTQTVNAAYAGNRGILSFYGLYRNQWVGLEGAPETLNFSINSPLGITAVGIGLDIISDKIGPSSESNIAFDLSYTINVSTKSRLSFGIKAGINLLSIDYSKLNIFNPNDPSYSINIKNRLSPLIGVGLYLHNSNKWYLGISTPNFISTTHYQEGIASSTVTERAHFYGIAGYVFDVNNTIKLKPALLTKIVPGSPISFDLSINVGFFNKLTLGLAHRLDAAGSLLAAFQVTDNLMIGYGYDYETTALSKYNSGSHEIFLRIELANKAKKIVSPRFF
ncbi:type IX secretion system membrane protein PorP/SprF [Flavobacterium sp. W22_SRS_FK3]|uniref:PorP/SprF family type IX secretion system membrane protein n=1 Tax=Flavobacterium sp. W22_SRS_FK3 TaxID=3240275 RepID=UPI003F8DA9ED